MQLPTRTWGEPGGRRALLVHGLNGNGESWWRIADELAGNGWHVTAVDLRGHGSAPAGDDLRLASYASDLPGSGWDLVVGHSLGGATAVLASTVAGFTKTLVLLDPVLEVDPAQREAIVADQVAELDLTIETLAAQKPSWNERDVALKVAGVRESSVRTATQSFSDNPDWNVVAELSSLRVPTLILGGDHAVYSMLATKTALAIDAANPLVAYRVVAGAGHSPHREQFEATIGAIRAFVG
jgi:pimeloyl-ACP methyl ester carboxylesterase